MKTNITDKIFTAMIIVSAVAITTFIIGVCSYVVKSRGEVNDSAVNATQISELLEEAFTEKSSEICFISDSEYEEVLDIVADISKKEKNGLTKTSYTAKSLWYYPGYTEYTLEFSYE